jgi:hypothetical protein
LLENTRLLKLQKLYAAVVIDRLPAPDFLLNGH